MPKFRCATCGHASLAALPTEGTTKMQEDTALQDPLDTFNSVNSIYRIAHVTSAQASRFLLLLVGHVRLLSSIRATSRRPGQSTEGKLHIARARASTSATVTSARCFFFRSPQPRRKSSACLSIRLGERWMWRAPTGTPLMLCRSLFW